MDTSEVLNRAADLIEQRGWIGRNGKGWSVTTSADGPLCVEGAIEAAMGGVSKWGGFMSGPNLCPAGQAVRDYLELGPYSVGTALFMWNDALDWRTNENLRTPTEVVGVLRAAALVEAARETEAAATEASVTP